MIERIVKKIAKEVQAAKVRGVILGLSGGVDSAVVAVLAKKALGRKRVLGLLLPCESHPGDFADAKLLCRKFGINHKAVDLTPVYRAIKKVFPKGNKLALANLKPRLRMLTLYYFANNLNYLVLGTGNKSELSVGYFTKYGDGGVDLLPIGGLLKTEVRRLAARLGIPDRVIVKPPTAGLWKGQTDECEMGLTYDLLDRMLAGKIKKSLKVRQMMAAGSHKIRMAKVL